MGTLELEDNVSLGVFRMRLICGDSMQELRNLDPCSIDAVVCDPPYGLGQTTPAQVSSCLQAWSMGETWKPKGSGFMGKSWDSWVPPPELWKEVIRVLKPGGHLIAFAGSRTQDLMSISLRLAGFEVRDTIQWLYGSGFPKSLNIGKAIDKIQGNEREVIGRNPNSREKIYDLLATANFQSKFRDIRNEIIKKNHFKSTSNELYDRLESKGLNFTKNLLFSNENYLVIVTMAYSDTYSLSLGCHCKQRRYRKRSSRWWELQTHVSRGNCRYRSCDHKNC